jgi:hypothetical protein
MGAVRAAIFSRQEFKQFTQRNIRKLFEEAGHINEIPLVAPLADGDKLHQSDVLGVRKRAVLRLMEGAQETIRVMQELNLEAAHPALNASLPHPQVLWAGEPGKAAGQQLGPEITP